jgi:serine/threonine protein kinase
VTDVPTRPSLDELFLKWKQFLAGGQFTTATFVAADHPALIDPLQRLINEHVSVCAAHLDSTLTVDPVTKGPPEPPGIPGYTLGRHLGRGGMGDVWEVRDQLDRPWALKLAHADRLSEAGRARFLDEARAMTRLNHPHVAPIHHYDRHGDVPFLLMPIYPASLKDKLEEYQADARKAVRLMAAVADGVGHLHARRLVHRDLKPGNVLLDADGNPAISDFGLIKAVGDDPSSLGGSGGVASGSAETRPGGGKRSRTRVGAVLGTRAYMSPQQAAGLCDLANSTWDVWALGVLLHELLTGQLPRSSESPERLLDPNEPDNPPPSSVKPGLDPRLERIVQRCLARKEGDRFQNGAAVAAELGVWLAPPRRLKRILLSVGLVLAIAFAVIAIRSFFLLSPREQILDDVANGRPVTLIADGQPPRFFEWRLGEVVTTTPQWDSDAAFTVDTEGAALVELVPPGGRPDRFRLRGKFRMNDTRDGSCRGGIYIAAGHFQTPRGLVEAVIELGFHNWVTKPLDGPPKVERSGQASVNSRLIGNIPDPIDRYFAAVYRPIEPPPADGQDRPYYDLALDVGPTEVTAWFDGRPFPPVNYREAAERLALSVREAGMPLDAPPDFRPTGGIGLIVIHGNCSFRDVVIERVP